MISQLCSVAYPLFPFSSGSKAKININVTSKKEVHELGLNCLERVILFSDENFRSREKLASKNNTKKPVDKTFILQQTYSIPSFSHTITKCTIQAEFKIIENTGGVSDVVLILMLV